MKQKQNNDVIETNDVFEKLVLFTLYKQNGLISIDFPKENEVLAFEIYGFLKIYLEYLKEQLFDSIEQTE